MTLAANKYKSAPHAQTQNALTPNFSLDATRGKISSNNNKNEGRCVCMWCKNRECHTHPAVRRIGFGRAAAVLLIAKRRILKPGRALGEARAKYFAESCRLENWETRFVMSAARTHVTSAWMSTANEHRRVCVSKHFENCGA